MAEFVYDPDGSHDVIPADSIEELAELNTMAAESLQQETARPLRADIVLRAVEYGALGENEGWLLYDSFIEEDGSVATVGGTARESTLVCLWRNPAGSDRFFVKLFREDIFVTNDDRTAMFCEEVFLDSDDDCFYEIHGSLGDEEGMQDNQNYPVFEVDDEGCLLTVPQLRTRVPLSYIIRGNSESDLVPIVDGVDFLVGEKDVVVPGLYFKGVDAAHALGRAESIWNEIRDQQPTAHYHQE